MADLQKHGEANMKEYVDYPDAIEVPATSSEITDKKVPCLTGTQLVFAALMISKLDFVQKILWSNVGFGCLRDLTLPTMFPPRFDPTVIHLIEERTKVYDPLLKPIRLAVPELHSAHYRTIKDYHAMYTTFQTTPSAVIEILLPLIRRDIVTRTSHSTAFISSNVSTIISAALASTARYAAGTQLSILDGVPTAVKDEYEIEGYRTTCGQKLRENMTVAEADETSWTVQKLEEHGAIVLGKLNQHEMGLDTNNNNPNYGTPLNPHNRDYYCGGSSGGAAYALAAGLIPIAFGTDGGGSIRIPSSYCGIYGLKPSHGRLEDCASSCTVTGPMAANLEDLEVAYRTMAIPNPMEKKSQMFEPPGTIDIERPKLMGIYKDWFDRADPVVRNACQRAIDYLVEIHHYTIVDISIPHVQEGQIGHAMTILSEVLSQVQTSHTRDVGSGSASRWSKIFKSKSAYLSHLTPANKIILSVGSQTSATDYILAQQLRNMIMSHLAWLWKKYPGMVIVTPTTPLKGWRIGKGELIKGVSDGVKSVRNMEYVWLANWTGGPSVSCPIGFVDATTGKKEASERAEGRKEDVGKSTVPVGLMALGEWGDEDGVLRWARDCERWLLDAHKGERKMPQIWVDVLALAREKSKVASAATKKTTPTSPDQE